MVNLIGGHFTRNGVKKDWPARAILSLNGNGMGEQHQDTIVIVRDTRVFPDGEAPPDFNSFDPGSSDITWEQYGQYWYADRTEEGGNFRNAWSRNQADYYQITNEQGGGGDDEFAMQRTVDVERAIARAANADGKKCCILNLAGGSPDFESWKRIMAPFIVEAWEHGGNIYGRHIYGHDNLVDDNGHPIGQGKRIIDELEYLKSIGYGGGVVLTEAGLSGGYGVVLWNRFHFQITKFEQALRPYADILIGMCWWECGNTEFNADYTDYLKQMDPYMIQNPLPKWEPPTSPTPPDPPGDTTEQKIFNLGQSWAFSVNMDAALQGTMITDGFFPTGEERWHEVDGTLYAIQPAARMTDTNDARVYYAIAYAWDNVMWTDGTDEPIDPSNPLDGLKLGYLFEYQYSNDYSGGRFNDPRPYGNGKHEGVDADVIGGQADNKCSVLCVYPGVVDRSLDSSGGYGKYVRVEHERNGSTFYTRYAHLDARYVNVGDSVDVGTQIGEVGATGNVTGEHVHLNLEVPGYGLSGYVVADVVDPAPYLPQDSMSLPPIETHPPDPPLGETINIGSYMIAYPTAWRVVYNIKPDGTRTGQDIRDMDLGNGLMVRSKSGSGDSAEWWRFDSVYAYLVADTSPAPDTMYTIAKNGIVGDSPKNKLTMRVGETWEETGSHWVQFKYKDGCGDITQPPTGANVNRAKLAWRNQNYKFPKMPVTLDVIALETTNNELQLYAKINTDAAAHYSVPEGLSIGWVGWASDWGTSELEELYFDRGSLDQEPNRFCNWE